MSMNSTPQMSQVPNQPPLHHQQQQQHPPKSLTPNIMNSSQPNHYDLNLNHNLNHNQMMNHSQMNHPMPPSQYNLNYHQQRKSPAFTTPNSLSLTDY